MVMKEKVKTMKPITPVKYISEVIAGTTHNGFPVIDEDRNLVGLITRDYLMVLLKN